MVQVVIRKTVLTATIIFCAIVGLRESLSTIPLNRITKYALPVFCITFAVATAFLTGFSQWQKLDGVITVWLVFVLISDNLTSLSLVWYLVRVSTPNLQQ